MLLNVSQLYKAKASANWRIWQYFTSGGRINFWLYLVTLKSYKKKTINILAKPDHRISLFAYQQTHLPSVSVINLAPWIINLMQRCCYLEVAFMKPPMFFFVRTGFSLWCEALQCETIHWTINICLIFQKSSRNLFIHCDRLKNRTAGFCFH